MRTKVLMAVAVLLASCGTSPESRPVPAPPAELTGRSDAGARVWLDARRSENTTGRVLELGAMAHIVGLFAPDDPEAWPEADPRSVAWREDVAALGNGETEVVGGGP